jgi:flagella synthesis protein FlgN
MSLTRHLELQTQTVMHLVELLERERVALAHAKIEGERLSELTACKEAVLLKLGQLEAIRAGAQLRLGYGSGSKGALKAAQDADCVAVWRRLQGLALRAKELNVANGGTLRLRMSCNQRILSFLNGLVSSKLYGPDGRVHHGESQA